MKIYLDEIDGAFYCDLVITQKELEAVNEFEMVDSHVDFDGKRYYMGVRLQGKCDYGKEESCCSEVDEEDDAGC